MGKRRALALAAVALAVPAFALGGERAPSAPATLSVSASLGGCGLAQSAIVCEIEASWSGLEAAAEYTVSVTRADGSVVDLGAATGTARTLYVSYTGAGDYSVEVTAWGDEPGEKLAEAEAVSEREAGIVRVAERAQRSAPAGQEARATTGAEATPTPAAAAQAGAAEPRSVLAAAGQADAETPEQAPAECDAEPEPGPDPEPEPDGALETACP